MSKYNLTDLYESMSRGATVNDSWYSISSRADGLDGENLGIDTYPIQVKMLGPSSDGKTTEEVVIRYGEGHKEYFSIYDYKFGLDPTDEDNYDNEYPFSLGVPTGNKNAKEWAAKLGFDVESMNEESIKEDAEEDARNDADYEAGWADDPRRDESVDMVKEEEGFTEVSTKEIKFHLDAYKAGNINGDDLAQAIEEIVFGETRAPGTMKKTKQEKEDIFEEMGPTGIAISKSQIDQLLDKGSIMGLEVVVTDKDGSNARKVDYILSNTDSEKDPDDYDDVREHFNRFK